MWNSNENIRFSIPKMFNHLQNSIASFNLSKIYPSRPSDVGLSVRRETNPYGVHGNLGKRKQPKFLTRHRRAGDGQNADILLAAERIPVNYSCCAPSLSRWPTPASDVIPTRCAGPAETVFLPKRASKTQFPPPLRRFSLAAHRNAINWSSTECDSRTLGDTCLALRNCYVKLSRMAVAETKQSNILNLQRQLSTKYGIHIRVFIAKKGKLT